MPPIIAATGHRPPKLGGYSPAIDTRLRNLARDNLRYGAPSKVISGMALGWDMAVAEAALELSIPLMAAIPFPTQPSLWPIASILRWKKIRDHASEVIIISDGYSPAAMQRRNEFMVDSCQVLLALWDGTPGGTANCINYAFRLKAREPNRDLRIVSTWSQYKEQP